MLKLVEVTSGYETNWHSILEQTTGLFNGIGLAVAMASVARWNPPRGDDWEPARPPATQPFALGFVLLGITYLNLRKNVGEWVRVKAVPPEMVGIATSTWFDLGYILLALTLLAILVRNARRPLAILPASPLGRGQLLYLVLLWWLVVGNFERALVSFTPQRLVTEGVIYVVALICSLLLLAGTPERPGIEPTTGAGVGPGLARTIVAGLLAATLSIVIDWAVVRAIYGDRFAGYASKHIRFGPDATIHRTGQEVTGRRPRSDSGRSGHRIERHLGPSGRDLGKMRPVLDRRSGPIDRSPRPAERRAARDPIEGVCELSRRLEASGGISLHRLQDHGLELLGEPRAGSRPAAAPGRRRGTPVAPARPRLRGSRWDARASGPRRGWHPSSRCRTGPHPPGRAAGVPGPCTSGSRPRPSSARWWRSRGPAPGRSRTDRPDRIVARPGGCSPA